MSECRQVCFIPHPFDGFRDSNSRHEQVSSRVRDTSTCGWRSVPVKSQNTTQQSQKIEGKDKHNHTAQGNTTDPPEEKTL